MEVRIELVKGLMMPSIQILIQNFVDGQFARIPVTLSCGSSFDSESWTRQVLQLQREGRLRLELTPSSELTFSEIRTQTLVGVDFFWQHRQWFRGFLDCCYWPLDVCRCESIIFQIIAYSFEMKGAKRCYTAAVPLKSYDQINTLKSKQTLNITILKQNKVS